MTVSAQHSSTKGDWMTPVPYVEASRATMGAIDLDPASSEEANQRIKAGQIYTVEDDGLIQPWFGRVFHNPPGTCSTFTGEFSEGGNPLYEFPGCGTTTKSGKRRKTCSCGLVSKFWTRLYSHYVLREVDQFIWVGFSLEQLQNLQGSAPLTPVDFSLCIPDHRIKYEDFTGAKNAPTHASYIAYGGSRKHEFALNFSQFGKIILQ